MAIRKLLLLTAGCALLCFVAAPQANAQTSSRTATINMQSGGTTSIQPPPSGTPTGAVDSEFDEELLGDADSGTSGSGVFAGINRSIATGVGIGAPISSKKKAKSNPELQVSVHGLDFFAQRFANGGNQFSVEPPDQALCVGNGYVLESVNDVIRVYDTNGSALAGVSDLNTFYGYAAAINRGTGARGPSLTDPVCHFDVPTQRWFHVVLTLDHAGITPSLNGNNHLDIAVSDTASPLGTWTIYKLPVQNNGTQGTPDHQCPGGFCLGDYPHIGADANGIYLTTNEFPFFAAGFHGALVYAISKQALVSGAANIPVFLFDTTDAPYLLNDDSTPAQGGPYPSPGFTVWPAISPGVDSFETANGGTEYLLSSHAVFNNSGADNRIRLWSITNTASLNTATPAISLNVGLINTQGYAVPAANHNQKVGDYPLGQSIRSAEGRIGRNDSRMQQVVFANGKIWGALDTAVSINNATQGGIAYFVFKPMSPTTGKVAVQGYIGMAGNHVTRPAVGVTPSGRGVIGFTLVGNDYYPTAAYTSLDALVGASDIHVAAAGAGPQDGFTEYRALSGQNRPRWGDYGAAAMDGNSVWIANEYINQTCTLATFTADTTCGGTRAFFGNWGTRMTKLVP